MSQRVTETHAQYLARRRAAAATTRPPRIFTQSENERLRNRLRTQRRRAQQQCTSIDTMQPKPTNPPSPRPELTPTQRQAAIIHSYLNDPRVQAAAPPLEAFVRVAR